MILTHLAQPWLALLWLIPADPCPPLPAAARPLHSSTLSAPTRRPRLAAAGMPTTTRCVRAAGPAGLVGGSDRHMVQWPAAAVWEGAWGCQGREDVGRGQGGGGAGWLVRSLDDGLDGQAPNPNPRPLTR